MRAVRYPPAGRRSAEAMRPAGWGVSGRLDEEWGRLGAETLVGIIVEDVEGLENLDEILEVEGLDFVNIGPGDLSLSMGRPMGHPAVVAAVEAAEARVIRRGMALETAAYTAEAARRAVAAGALLIRCSPQKFVTDSFREWIAAATDAA